MYKYNSATGGFYLRDIDSVPYVYGYSGHGVHKNCPEDECIRHLGPIPRGKYRIGPRRDDPGGLGPVVMNLDPLPGTNTFGRSLFRIHGDNKEHNASHGCIILPRAIREMIAESGEHELLVV